MLGAGLVSLALRVLDGSPPVAQQSCAAAADLETHALEVLGAPSPSTQTVDQAAQLLERATSLCPSNGDLWWYRSLTAKLQGDNLRADFFRSQADANGSAAMKAGKGLGGAALAAASTSSRAPMSVSPYVRKRLALVVGIGQFKDDQINPLK